MISLQRNGIALALGAGLLLFAWVAANGVKDSARSIVSGAGDLADNVLSGTVEGIGQIVGIDPTNADQCTKDKAAGDSWAASFSCPAADYIRWLWNR